MQTLIISLSTLSSVAAAAIFSLHTDPRLVMPLSQYLFNVYRSSSLNWVLSWSYIEIRFRKDISVHILDMTARHPREKSVHSPFFYASC